MKHATVEDVTASSPHPIPTHPTYSSRGAGYHTIHAIHKLLQANAQAIDTHLGGDTLGHLCIIVSPAAYAIVAPTAPREIQHLQDGTPQPLKEGVHRPKSAQEITFGRRMLTHSEPTAL
jgi:hypothetical protein